MPTDVSRSYGTARAGKPLSDAQQQRLRELAGKTQHSPLELYELGALKGQAKSTQQGQQVLSDVAHEEQAAHASRRRAQASRQGRQQQSQSRQDARRQGSQQQPRTGRASDPEFQRRLTMLREHLAEGD